MNFPLFIIIVLGIYFIFFWKKKEEELVLTDEFTEVLNTLENTNQSIFISGKAGTGKSSLLRYFVKKTKKKHVILAPTGLAALNIHGQTIHSFFKFPPTPIDPQKVKVDYARNSIFSKLDLIIIDEISMVSANLLDGIDSALRKNRNRPEEPFGGVQMVFIGDLFQLPPVVKKENEKYFHENYGGVYFFYAPVFKTFSYTKKELTHVFRQKDPVFKETLNRIRINAATFQDFVLLNTRFNGNHVAGLNEVTLTTTNRNVKRINKENIDKLESLPFTYKANLTGTLQKNFKELEDRLIANQITEAEFEDQLENRYPTSVYLVLKVGAQVMMIKNDFAKRWENGTVGVVKDLTHKSVVVEINGKNYSLEKEDWEEIEYAFNENTKEIEPVSLGKFSQFPIKTAWAITIHKSQGKTFERVVIDIGGRAFSHGQTYVALSRCTTLEGIILSTQIQDKDIIVDHKVIEYYQEFANLDDETEKAQGVVLNA